MKPGLVIHHHHFYFLGHVIFSFHQNNYWIGIGSVLLNRLTHLLSLKCPMVIKSDFVLLRDIIKFHANGMAAIGMPVSQKTTTKIQPIVFICVLYLWKQIKGLTDQSQVSE